MLGESYYRLSPNFTLDQSYTRSAIKEFQAFIDFFPTDEQVLEAEKKINELMENEKNQVIFAIPFEMKEEIIKDAFNKDERVCIF